MTISKSLTLSLAVVAVALSGCMSSRLDNGGGGDAPQVVMPGPSSSGGISQSTLPPPSESFPAAPSNNVASANTAAPSQNGSQEPPSNAADLTPASVAGVWKASIGGLNCQIATPQTKYGQGYRAGPLHCPASFTGVSSWAVNGKQLNFYDNSGSPIATLYSAGSGRFEGNTVNGQAVILSR